MEKPQRSNTDASHNIEDFFTFVDGKNPQEFLLKFRSDSFKRSRAFLLCILTFSCTCVSFFINLYEGSTVFFLPLAGIFFTGIICFFYLLFFKAGECFISMVLWIILLGLGIFIILCDPSIDHRSLLWVSIFPPICILTMGLFHASILFCAFLLALLAIFITPLQEYMINPISTGVQIRLIITLVSSFLLIAYVDYSRSKIYTALQNTVMHIGKTSLTDSITGLGNKLYYIKFLEWIMANSTRSKRDYTVALLNIDHFKKTSEIYGSDISNDILIHFTQTLNKQVRNTDMLLRYNEDDFVIVMPNCNAEESEIAAERFRSHIERTPYPFGNESNIPITVSIGLYSGNEAKNTEIPIRIASKNLYKAKSNGGNTLVR